MLKVPSGSAFQEDTRMDSVLHAPFPSAYCTVQMGPHRYAPVSTPRPKALRLVLLLRTQRMLPKMVHESRSSALLCSIACCRGTEFVSRRLVCSYDTSQHHRALSLPPPPSPFSLFFFFLPFFPYFVFQGHGGSTDLGRHPSSVPRLGGGDGPSTGKQTFSLKLKSYRNQSSILDFMMKPWYGLCISYKRFKKVSTVLRYE